MRRERGKKRRQWRIKGKRREKSVNKKRRRAFWTKT